MGKGPVKSRCHRIEGSRDSMQHCATFDRGLDLVRGQASMSNIGPDALQAQLEVRNSRYHMYITLWSGDECTDRGFAEGARNKRSCSCGASARRSDVHSCLHRFKKVLPFWHLKPLECLHLVRLKYRLVNAGFFHGSTPPRLLLMEIPNLL